MTRHSNEESYRQVCLISCTRGGCDCLQKDAERTETRGSEPGILSGNYPYVNNMYSTVVCRIKHNGRYMFQCALAEFVDWRLGIPLH